MQDTKRDAALEHKLIFEGLECGSDDVCEMMSRIHEYLQSSYYLAINPLPQLRRILPKYEWKFARVESLSEARSLVSKADFVWVTDKSHHVWLDDSSTEEQFERCFPTEFATATLAGRSKPLNYSFVGDKPASRTSTPELLFANACGADPVYYNITNK